MGELSVIIDQPLEKAEASVRLALKEQGFGVLTEIDVAQVFKDKLDVTRRPLKILGACNPVMASEAISRDIDVALVLPCNVVLDAVSDTQTVVSIADPMTIMPGADLFDLVDQAKKRLAAVLETLTKPGSTVEPGLID